MTRARTPAAKTDRRNMLLLAALEQFYECGYSAARMEDIAERANVSKGTIYLYFSSKEAMFLALIEEMTSPNIAKIEETVGRARSAEDAIRTFVEFGSHVVRDTDLPKLMKVLIAESRSFPDIAALYRSQVIDRLLGVVVDVLEKAKARGEIEFDDAAATARLIMAPMTFAGVWTGVFGTDRENSLEIEALFAEHFRMTLRALRSEDASR